ncbi:tumor necrosis factor receptor superfamily member 6 isoform X1 [Suricata suricatta]|uniref:Tumor necrosis factor receptor superfamily member 6 n=1 Tax=Suricata suricatta TaxID=37032 RepID=A0A673TTR6_SURSU|nr:tumor necrosis factor receptor superfamily member 6 isoform X1 [Suricata suricatta]
MAQHLTLLLDSCDLILTSVAGPLFRGDSAQVTAVNSKVLKLSKNVTEGASGCKEGLHRGSKFCCLPCPPGTTSSRLHGEGRQEGQGEKHVGCCCRVTEPIRTMCSRLHGTQKAADCENDGGQPSCTPCEEGKDYTDGNHFSSRCRRCRICDGEHGLEVEKNCTRTQNTKCRCKSNFFCNVSLCEHCDPCITCEHGILEACTPTSNTKCKQGSNLKYLWFCVPILILLSAPACWYVIKQRRIKKYGCTESLVSTTESMPMNFTDIDLSKYISSIAEQMKITQVKEFVRKNGINEAKIDEIKNDNLRDTAEQKVQLLRNWYQLHGRKGAYYTLITGLRKANLCTLAEKIQDMVQKDITG